MFFLLVSSSLFGHHLLSTFGHSTLFGDFTYLAINCLVSCPGYCNIMALALETRSSSTLTIDNTVAKGEALLRLSDQMRHPTIDDYQLIMQLGHGNMGTVFLAADRRESEKLFALKLMSKEELIKRNIVARAAMEKGVLSVLRGPFLPSLYAHFETEKYQILVIDYCSGGDLNALRRNQPEQKFSHAAARFYGAEVVLALEHLHKLGFVYRDLKPENVLVQSSGHIMLTDFDLCLKILNKQPHPLKQSSHNLLSIFSCVCMELEHMEELRSQGPSTLSPAQKPPTFKARVTPVESNTVRSYSFVGTEEYIAPEILWGTGHDFPVDWWTLGVLLYELVFGITPFKSYGRKETFFNILSKEPKLSGPWTPLHDLIKQLLIKDPTQRLGYKHGADEVKSHRFFQGVRWDVLQFVSRPPYVPSPLSLEETMESQSTSDQGANVELDHLATVDLAGRSTELSFDRSSVTPQNNSSSAISSGKEAHRPNDIVSMSVEKTPSRNRKEVPNRDYDADFHIF